MMGLLPRSLAGRTLAALCVALLLLFLAMAAVHTVLLARTVDKAAEEILARQLSSLMDSVAAAPEWDRDAIAHGLSRSDLEVHWLPANVPDPWGNEHVRWVPLSDRIRDLSRFPTAVRIRPGTIDADQKRILGVAAISDFPDGSHLLVRMSSFNLLTVDTAALYGYAAATALFVLGAAALALRSATAPLTALSTAVQGLSLEEALPAVGDHAPEEVRTLARRLNDMADRVRAALRQRTLALAALSHDVMSPVSRLKLRAAEMPDGDQRQAIQRDLAEIETMVTDVLAFLRGGHESEPVRMLHMASIVQTLVDEFASTGEAVAELRMDDVVIEGRPTALKRAIGNLISNAVTYGRAPWIAVENRGSDLAIRVGDNGPGIPASDLPLIMTPFFRGDRARAAGGGSGLGLPIARAIAVAHGGDLTIESPAGQGVVATLLLPKKMRATTSDTESRRFLPRTSVNDACTTPGRGCCSRNRSDGRESTAPRGHASGR